MPTPLPSGHVGSKAVQIQPAAFRRRGKRDETTASAAAEESSTSDEVVAGGASTSASATGVLSTLGTSNERSSAAGRPVSTGREAANTGARLTADQSRSTTGEGSTIRSTTGSGVGETAATRGRAGSGAGDTGRAASGSTLDGGWRSRNVWIDSRRASVSQPRGALTAMANKPTKMPRYGQTGLG